MFAAHHYTVKPLTSSVIGKLIHRLWLEGNKTVKLLWHHLSYPLAVRQSEGGRKRELVNQGQRKDYASYYNAPVREWSPDDNILIITVLIMMQHK